MSRMTDMRRRQSSTRIAMPHDAGDSVDPAADPVRWMWRRYHKSNQAFDNAFIEKWRNDLDGVLVFTGLFSAMVSAFFIDSYHNLQPDPNRSIIRLLTGISTSLDTPTGAPPSNASAANFTISPQDLRASVFFLYSLFFSVTCALAATLVQRWARMFTQDTTTLPVPGSELGRRRALTVVGAVRFFMPAVCENMPFFLHIFVFLFFAGLVDYLRSINDLLADTMLGLVTYMSIGYAVLTVLPLLWRDCPYQTPVSFVIWRALLVLTFLATVVCRLAIKVLEKTTSRPTRGFFEAPPRFYRPFTMCLGEFTARARANGKLRVSDAVALLDLAGSFNDACEKTTFLEGFNGFLEDCGVDLKPGTLDGFHHEGLSALRYLADHAAPIIATMVSVLSSPDPHAALDACEKTEAPANATIQTCMQAFRLVTLHPTHLGRPRHAPKVMFFQSTESINDVARIVPLLRSIAASASADAATAVTARSMLALIVAEALYIASQGGAERAGFVWMVREHLLSVCPVDAQGDDAAVLKDGPYACVSTLLEDVLPHIDGEAALSYILHPALRVAAACAPEPPAPDALREAFSRVQLLADGMTVCWDEGVSVLGGDSDTKTLVERPNRVVPRREGSFTGRSQEAYRRLLEAIRPFHTALVHPTASESRPAPVQGPPSRKRWLPLPRLTHRHLHGKPSSGTFCKEISASPEKLRSEDGYCESVAEVV